MTELAKWGRFSENGFLGKYAGSLRQKKSVLANQATVHSGGVSRRGSLNVVLGFSAALAGGFNGSGATILTG